MYYKGPLTDEFKNQQFVTILENPIEGLNANFKGAESQPDTRTMAKILESTLSADAPIHLSYKPRTGFWGSFADVWTYNGESICGWEDWHITNGYTDTKDKDSSFSFPNGIFGITYKLPEDAKVLIFKESDFEEKKQLLKDYDFDVKKMMEDVDIIIETSGASPWDVPSICVTNLETFKKLEIIDNWYKDYFDSPKQYFIKDGEVSLEEKELIIKKIEVNPDCFQFLPDEVKEDKEIFLGCIDKGIIEIAPYINDYLKYDREVINKIVDKFSEFECSEKYNLDGFRRFPNELIEAINLNKENIKEERLELSEQEENLELDDL